MGQLFAKMAEIMGVVGYVQKDSVNESQGYRYASAEAVLRKVNAECSKRGIAVSSESSLIHYQEHTSGGKTKMRASVQVTLRFSDGTDSITFSGIGEGMDAGDKAILKANTSALKYALASGFLISWGDDPEADPATDRDSAGPPEPAEKPRSRPRKPTLPTAEELFKAIREASSKEELDALKQQVKQLASSPEFDSLRRAWMQRNSEVS